LNSLFADILVGRLWCQWSTITKWRIIQSSWEHCQRVSYAFRESCWYFNYRRSRQVVESIPNAKPGFDIFFSKIMHIFVIIYFLNPFSQFMFKNVVFWVIIIQIFFNLYTCCFIFLFVLFLNLSHNHIHKNLSSI